ncbi:hypothetical protein [Pseudozobellia thermophila]|uniref:Uncharacterized protein n=1 Tax=Pseudozobellia thermophila TaxID=192903 RepID=A0A1M6APU7_9FLAO|nr:hypothetical protein [Pseudozobellia thermophila]SHI38520.1 hypothetical protein SAMN04488513_101141 [Pseudozobellia thermophila]
MNWHNALKDIYRKLEASGYKGIKEDIHEGQLSGGTGGEFFSIVLTKLIEIKKNQPIVYCLLKKEVDEFIAYAKSINYLNSDFKI